MSHHLSHKLLCVIFMKDFIERIEVDRWTLHTDYYEVQVFLEFIGNIYTMFTLCSCYLIL